MSAYANDPRVQKVDDNYIYVRVPSDIFIGGERSAAVWPNQEAGGWAAEIDSSLTTYPTADEAIRSLIGDPQ